MTREASPDQVLLRRSTVAGDPDSPAPVADLENLQGASAAQPTARLALNWARALALCVGVGREAASERRRGKRRGGRERERKVGMAEECGYKIGRAHV